MSGVVSNSRRGRAIVSVVWAAIAVAGLFGAAGLPQPGAGDPPPAKAGWYAVSSGGGREAPGVWGSAALALGPGESPHPAVAAASCIVTLSGDLAIDRKGKYRFTVECEGGSATLTVYDSAARVLGTARGGSGGRAGQTAWIDLASGKAPVTVKFTRRGEEPARLRTLWEREGVGEAGFVLEPVPAASVTIPPFAKDKADGAARTARGRALLAELGCASCHSSGGVQSPAGPELGEIGARVAPAWVEKWIANPAVVKAHSRMPRVLGDAPKDRSDAAAITQFLYSVGYDPDWEAPATEAAGLRSGRMLYHTVGCVACHGPLESPGAVFGEAAEPVEAGWKPPAAPEPFGDLAGKWRPSALASFLKDPLAMRPAGRMPSMALSDEEADFIATYLVSQWNKAPAMAFTPKPELVDAGRAAFAARGCASCHGLGTNRPVVASTLAAPALAKLNTARGCLDPKDAKSPRYELHADDRAALSIAVKEVSAWGDNVVPASLDVAALAIDGLGCRNCHEYGGAGGLADDLKPYFRANVEADLGDEGRLPPRLTGAGSKLTTSYARDVLLSAARARPYMATRMPQFGEQRAGALAAALSRAEGVFPEKDRAEPEASNERVAAGRRLVGDKGMNCISCHTFGDAAPAGTPGPDITMFAARLRHEWFSAYIMDPQRFKPGTKMTAFYHTLDGKGMVKDVLGGDPAAQSDALWAYFTLGEFAPEPDGLPRAGGDGLALKVERPVVFRTFLKDAGSRGIAVGYPPAMGGLHFAFDAEVCRLVDAWRGDFLDATGAWKNRGGQITGGRGGVVWSAPEGPALLIASAPGAEDAEAVAPRFGGYSVDDKGVPTFRYSLGAVQVEERFESEGGGHNIVRNFSVSGLPANGSVWVNAGPNGTIAPSDIAHLQEVTIGDVHWFGFTPEGKRITFTVRIPVKEGTP